MRSVEIPHDRPTHGGHGRPAAVAERADGSVRQLGDPCRRPWEQSAGIPAIGRDLKAVAAHERLVPDELARVRIVEQHARDRREIPLLAALVVGSDIDPFTPICRARPHRQCETLGHGSEPRAVEVGDEHLGPLGTRRTSRKHHAIAAWRQQRLHIARTLTLNHALATTVLAVEPHEREIVGGGERILTVVLHPDRARVRARQLLHIARRTLASLSRTGARDHDQ